jgi:hypothetical protein
MLINLNSIFEFILSSPVYSYKKDTLKKLRI